MYDDQMAMRHTTGANFDPQPQAQAGNRYTVNTAHTTTWKMNPGEPNDSTRHAVLPETPEKLHAHV